ncbi:hypothetical protein MMC10_008298 [Thelotrema lepadinum]|nr:hypothetical protein [Thelotrema lepadinum]
MNPDRKSASKSPSDEWKGNSESNVREVETQGRDEDLSTSAIAGIDYPVQPPNSEDHIIRSPPLDGHSPVNGKATTAPENERAIPRSEDGIDGTDFYQSRKSTGEPPEFQKSMQPSNTAAEDGTSRGSTVSLVRASDHKAKGSEENEIGLSTGKSIDRPHREPQSGEPIHDSRSPSAIRRRRPTPPPEEVRPYDLTNRPPGNDSRFSAAPRSRALSPRAPEYIRVKASKRKNGHLDFIRFDNLFTSQVNIGYSTLDKVKVDCKLLLSKTKWGSLGAGSSMFSAEVPAGIMYMDLTFDQPKDCKLSSATVYVTLDDGATELEHFRNHHARSQSSGIHPRKKEKDHAEQNYPPVSITDWFGPKAIAGRERLVGLNEHLHATPNLGFGGINIGGIGYDRASIKERPSRWTFTGQMIAAGAGPDRGRGRAKTAWGDEFRYKGLRWTLSENDLEPQATHSPVIHTAFAFVHSREPVLLRIQIEGKLKGMGARARNKWLEFSSVRRGKDDSVSTLINLSNHVSILPLDQQAQGLELEMQWANLAATPVEIPDPMPAAFTTVAPTQREWSDTAWLRDTTKSKHTVAASKLREAGKILSSHNQTALPQRATSPLSANNVSIHDSHTSNIASDGPDPMVDALVRSFSEIAALTQQPPPRAKGFQKSPPAESRSNQDEVGSRGEAKERPFLEKHEPLGKGSSPWSLPSILYYGSVAKAFWHSMLCWIFAVIARNR